MNVATAYCRCQLEEKQEFWHKLNKVVEGFPRGKRGVEDVDHVDRGSTWFPKRGTVGTKSDKYCRSTEVDYFLGRK